MAVRELPPPSSEPTLSAQTTAGRRPSCLRAEGCAPGNGGRAAGMASHGSDAQLRSPAAAQQLRPELATTGLVSCFEFQTAPTHRRPARFFGEKGKRRVQSETKSLSQGRPPSPARRTRRVETGEWGSLAGQPAP